MILPKLFRSELNKENIILVLFFASPVDFPEGMNKFFENIKDDITSIEPGLEKLAGDRWEYVIPQPYDNRITNQYY